MTNKNKEIYNNEMLGVKVEETESGFIVRHGKKEMCPTSDKNLALIYAKGYERGLADGKKLNENK